MPCAKIFIKEEQYDYVLGQVCEIYMYLADKMWVKLHVSFHDSLKWDAGGCLQKKD